MFPAILIDLCHLLRMGILGMLNAMVKFKMAARSLTVID